MLNRNLLANLDGYANPRFIVIRTLERLYITAISANARPKTNWKRKWLVGSSNFDARVFLVRPSLLALHGVSRRVVDRKRADNRNQLKSWLSGQINRLRAENQQCSKRARPKT